MQIFTHSHLQTRKIDLFLFVMSCIFSLVPLLDKIFLMPYWIRAMRWYPCTASDLDAFSVMPCAFLDTIFIMCISDITSLFLNCSAFLSYGNTAFLSNALLYLQKWSEGFYPLLYWFVYVELSWMETNLIMLKYFLMYCWIGLLVFCWEFLHLCLSGILVIACLPPSPLCLPPFIYNLYFLWLSCPCLILESRLCWPHRIIFGKTLCFQFCRRIGISSLKEVWQIFHNDAVWSWAFLCFFYYEFSLNGCSLSVPILLVQFW